MTQSLRDLRKDVVLLRGFLESLREAREGKAVRVDLSAYR
jgi:hypothetical protein